ncbi:N-acetyltransferase [Terasakiella pusilla]|uniref:N-acetyltransferase n=1 Tax=Terasakiella pusilla TaxID=64973 RepID=UPI003AA7F6A0
MIRKFDPADMDTVLDIWLEASVLAHDFVEQDFWHRQLQPMREIYIPASDTFVYQVAGQVVGFYALYEESLAAIFVAPNYQGRGIGKVLLSHAKTMREKLSLCVYKENQKSYRFYLSQGFTVIGEQQDKHTGHPEFLMSN